MDDRTQPERQVRQDVHARYHLKPGKAVTGASAWQMPAPSHRLQPCGCSSYMFRLHGGSLGQVVDVNAITQTGRLPPFRVGERLARIAVAEAP